MRHLSSIAVAIVVCFASLAVAGPPVVVSPGRTDLIVPISGRCPTFSWGVVPEAVTVRLEVWAVPTDAAAQPTLLTSVELTGTATSWTPELVRCLAAGGTYAWRIGAAPASGEIVWSEPSWFAIPPEPGVVMGSGGAAAVGQAGAASSVGTDTVHGAETAAGTETGARPVPEAARSASYFSVGNSGKVTAGAVTADSFSGDGSALTNLNATQLTSGTVPPERLTGSYDISVTGTAANVTGTVAIDHGGTSATDAATARTNLGAAAASHAHGSTGVTGLAAGEVLFGNGSGNIGQDASFFWDDTNKRLGLGTGSPAQQLELTGMMKMPVTAATSGTPTAGVLYLGTDPFLHGYASPGSDGLNTFLGQGAGNFTMSWSSETFEASRNTAVGASSLTANTTGRGNTAIGVWSLKNNTTGRLNTATGGSSLEFNTSGNFNTATGVNSQVYNTAGSYNTAAGFDSLFSNTTASKNTAVGSYALYAQSYDGGESFDSLNTAIGYRALYTNDPTEAANGIENTALGANALFTNTTGSRNIAVGTGAGQNLTTGDHNIDIGNQGVAAEGNTIRIGGSNQTRAFIAGIHGVTPAGEAQQVVVDASGQFGSTGVTGYVSSVFGRTGAVETAAGDYAAEQVTNVQAGNIAATDVQAAINELDTEKSSTGHTHTSTGITGLATGGVLFGDGSGNIGQESSNLFFWDDTNGRLGLGTSSPNEQLEITGNLRLPTTASPGTAGVLLLGTTRFMHAFHPTGGSDNTFLGYDAGNFTMGGTGTDGTSNTGLGYLALRQTTSGFNNTAVGTFSLSQNTTGTENTAVGKTSLYDNTTGADNTAVGFSAGHSNQTGSSNVFLGHRAGYNETGSNKLYIANTEESTLIFGEFVAGLVGIANTDPSVAFDVNGQIRARTWSGTGDSTVCRDHDGVLVPCSGTADGVTSFNTRTGAVVPASGDYTAEQVNNVPAGNVAATDVQAAVNELDTEKSAAGHTHTSTAITGLTTGGVLFGDGSGNIGQDASSLFWDDTNNRLGIGISSPAKPLHQKGLGAVFHSIDVASPRTSAFFSIDIDLYSSTEGALSVYDRRAQSYLSRTPTVYIENASGATLATNPLLQVVAAGTTRLLVQHDGKVGIGTASPGAVLDVIGQVSVDTVRGHSGAKVVIAGYDNGIGSGKGVELDAVEEGFDFRTHTGGSWGTRMFITDAGRVGIADTDPSVALDVNGQIRSRSWSGMGDATVCRDGNGVLVPCSGTGDGVTSFNTRTGAVVPTSGDYTASQVTNVAAGGISSTDVQAAINELDGDKAALVHTHGGGDITSAVAQATNADTLDSLHASSFVQGETVVVVDDDFDTASLASLNWSSSVTGEGAVRHDQTGVVLLDTGHSTGSAVIYGNQQFALSGATLIFKATMNTYGNTSPDHQPRGLVNGTDRNNNAIEFTTSASTSTAVDCRTVSGGNATVTTVDIGHSVESNWTAYQIVASSSVVKFYVDGSLIATHTTNIPTVALNLYFGTNAALSVPVYINHVSLERRF